MIHLFKTVQAGFGFDFDIELSPDQQVYCFIGKNGIGKTQLLENIAKSLFFIHSLFDHPSLNRPFSNYFGRADIFNSLKDIVLKLPMGITVNDIEVKNKIQYNWGCTTLEQLATNVRPRMVMPQNWQLVCEKPIVFIGAKNRGFTKNIDPKKINILGDFNSRFAESILRTIAYINGDGLINEEVANWFVSRVILNPKFIVSQQNKQNEVVTVLKLIEKLEPSLRLVTNNINSNGVIESVTINLTYGDGKLIFNGIPFDKLSTGFVSVIKIFQEIVAGYGGWSNLDDLSQVDGIVFIDEVEPHLHISWQTKILQILREFFPLTTFYVSTHSPLVLAGLRSGEAYELYRNEKIIQAKLIENIEQYYLTDLVNEFFGVDINLQKLNNINPEQQKHAKELLLKLAGAIDYDGN
ncbi:MAG: hypothetical protein QG673_1933 [Pseudomonadota bacterium]|nr:hypothetical protein [Pseudomonadota bacterium]